MHVQVSPALNIFESLTYGFNGDPGSLKPGTRVVIPIGTRIVTGWVTRTDSQYKGRVKNILAVVRDDFLPGSRFMEFIDTVCGTYFTSVGSLLDSSLPPNKKPMGSLYFRNNDKEGKIEKLNKYSLKEIGSFSKTGTPDCFYKPGDTLIDSPAFPMEPGTPGEGPVKNRFILSYSRESFYREIIDDCLHRGRSVLIAVPDNLTAANLREKLGEVDVYNSELKPKERNALWDKYARGETAGVVVGGLSAVLLPIPNLGAVICERAGSAAYKRSYFSRYHTHLLARLRARHFNVPLIEGFSTRTVQSFRDSSRVAIEDKREEKIPVDVRMIKSGTRGLPENFIELLGAYFAEKKKILVVLNRKESFNFLFCMKCKKILRCPKCDGLIDVDHESNIKCIRCGFEKANQDNCFKCGEAVSVVEDVSIASVKKAVKGRVVETGVMTLSSEGLKEDHLYSLMRRIEDSHIVISTPVIVNPYFSRMFDAVVYVRPESYFNIDQYDAAEKIFSLVAELRELLKPGGTLDIFSIFHFHYSLKLLNDEEGFFDRELKYREWFHLPPFANVYHIEVKSKDLRKLGKEMRNIYQKFKEPLNIKRIYLGGRKAVRGVYKGVLEAHAQPESIRESGLLGKRDIFIDLVLI